MQFSSESKANSIVRLQFYNESPQGKLQLSELESLAVERLKALKLVETVGQDFVKGSKEYSAHLRDQLEKSSEMGRLLASTASSLSDQARKDIRADVVSHFVLRIAYCHSDALRKWFVQQEVDLFRFRFEAAERSTVARFLSSNDIRFEAVEEEEKRGLKAELTGILPGQAAAGFDNLAYFKVPFTEVLDLVRSRRVILQSGLAFVPEHDLTSLVSARFRAHLSHALSVTSRALPYLEEDTRLLPVLSALSRRYLGQEFGNRDATSEVVRADQVDQLAKNAFPPCMQHLHHALRRDSHLRHGGRRQYGLFLKGVGLPMEESLKFWRSAFQKKFEADQFEKRFAYNVRHSYGKEGKRTSYMPFSCVKIITQNQPGTGDFHGCPFRHNELNILRQRLQSAPQSSHEKVETIVAKAKDKQYQLACRDFFKMTHNVDQVDMGINHPNQYFEMSQKIARGTENVNPEKPNKPSRVVKVKAMNASQASTMSASLDESAWEDMEDSELSQIDLSTVE